jgi:hypothetical protein
MQDDRAAWACPYARGRFYPGPASFLPRLALLHDLIQPIGAHLGHRGDQAFGVGMERRVEDLRRGVFDARAFFDFLGEELAEVDQRYQKVNKQLSNR